jgi:hypothetical protein
MSTRPDSHPTRGRRAGAIVVATAIALGALTGTVFAFSGQAGNHNNEITGAPDWVPPATSRAVVQKAEGGTPGFIRQGAGFRILAQVTDSGNPASGVASAKGLISGRADATLSSGSFTAGGLTYNQRSGLETLASPTAAGSYALGVGATDAAGNSATQGGFSFVVDNTVPTATNIETVNRTGGTAGRPEVGDSAVFTTSEQLDPYSLISNWDGSGSQNVVVRINNNAAAGSNDQLVVYNAANSAALPLGSVNLGRNNYVSANVTFGASGTASTMTQSGGVVTVTFGTLAGTTSTVTNNAALAWTPSTTAFDRAGNLMSATVANESGTNDRNF